MIDLSSATFWEHLVWLDTANHGGILELGAPSPAKKRSRKKARQGKV
jgi:hypothetical protein